jgi:hypothetical protein
MRYRRIVAVFLIGAAAASAQITQGRPETVMATFHARPGFEAELEKLIEDHWVAGRRIGAMEPTPHLTVRGIEGDSRTFFVHIFTWRDDRIPDAAPPEILAIWTRMNALVESRDGHAGIEFVQVATVGR